MRPRSALGPAAEPRSRSRLDQMPGAFLIRTSYPQHIHNLKTPEFDLFTGTCCAQIHRCAGKIETRHCGKKTLPAGLNLHPPNPPCAPTPPPHLPPLRPLTPP